MPRQFGQGLAALGQAQMAQEQEMKNAELEREVKGKKLELEAGQLEFQMKQHRDKLAEDGFKNAVKTMEALAATAANSPAIKPGGALDNAIDMQKNIVAKFAEMTGQDPNMAFVLAENARQGAGQALKNTNVPMGGVVLGPDNQPIFHNPVQQAPQLPPEKLRLLQGANAIMQKRFGRDLTEEESLNILGVKPETEGFSVTTTPGEFGTTTEVTQGGRGRKGMSQQSAQAVVSGGPPAGEGGKPLPKDAQDNLTGAFGMLQGLNQIEERSGKAGIVKGWINWAKGKAGIDDDATAFNVASENVMLAGQAIIKGIPSNFDIQRFERVQPQITDAESVVKEKILYSRKLTHQLIKDTIGYYKYTGFRIPPETLKQAQAFGVDLSDAPVWDGQGFPTKKSAAMLEKAPGVAPGIKSNDKQGLRPPVKGEVMDGYMFQGGDPSEENNWTKVK